MHGAQRAVLEQESPRAFRREARVREHSIDGRSLLRWAIVALGGAVLALCAATAHAQEPVRVIGWVQWVAANKMQIVGDGGGSVAIDLTEADQSSYRGLRMGELVYVDGYVAPDRSRIMARNVWRNSASGWSQSP